MRRQYCLVLLLLLAALALHRSQYGAELRSAVAECRASQAQAQADRQAIAELQRSVEGERHRVLDFARCYRSCLFMCTKKGVRGTRDEMRLCTSSCITQCEALANVKEIDLAALG